MKNVKTLLTKKELDDEITFTYLLDEVLSIGDIAKKYKVSKKYVVKILKNNLNVIDKRRIGSGKT